MAVGKPFVTLCRQTVSCWRFDPEAVLQSCDITCGVFGGQCVIGTGVYTEVLWLSRVAVIPPVLNTHLLITTYTICYKQTPSLSNARLMFVPQSAPSCRHRKTDPAVRVLVFSISFIMHCLFPFFTCLPFSFRIFPFCRSYPVFFCSSFLFYPHFYLCRALFPLT